MKLHDLSAAALSDKLICGELIIQAGPLRYRIQSELPSIRSGLQTLYADYPVLSPEHFADFNLKLEHGAGLHRWWRQQVRFSSDGSFPFEPLPISHAYPQLEWAMNWCVSMQAHQYLMLHSAVVERNGQAVILPAPPGSGKSTLCAALVQRGWRLLTDEIALISLADGLIYPAARPVSLKNESIAVIKSFAPEAVFNEVTHNTSKGSVTHMKVPAAHLLRMQEPARARWVIFPKYVPGSSAEMSDLTRGQTMLELATNAFNYSLLGLTGFRALASVIEQCEGRRFQYSKLEEAMTVFDRLSRSGPTPA